LAHRLWKQAKLQVRKIPRKRRVARAVGTPVQAVHPGHVWTYDFVHDACLNGTALKVLTVMDEFTREGLAIDVATTMPAAKVLAILDRLFREHGAPQFLRSDNGPEFIALAVRGWLVQHQTATLYIDPGCPWQNGYEERFNGTVRDACLNPHSFHTVTEARGILTA
jgi:putative transposase